MRPEKNIFNRRRALLEIREKISNILKVKPNKSFVEKKQNYLRTKADK